MEYPRQTALLEVDIVVVDDGRRPLDQERVVAIAASIQEVGQLSPIIVRVAPDGSFHLVTGRHRLAAMKSLDRANIAAVILRPGALKKGTRPPEGVFELDVQLMEIDENLCRKDLSEPERVKLTARRSRVIAERDEIIKKELEAHSAPNSFSSKTHPKKKAEGGPKPGKPKTTFVKETAKVTNRSERAVEKDLSRAKLGDEILDAVEGTPLSTGAALDKLLKVPEAQRLEIVTAPDPEKALEAALPKKAGSSAAIGVIDPAMIPPSKQQRFDAAIRQHKRKLDAEFEARVLDECRKRVDEFILPEHVKEQEEARAVIKARKGVMPYRAFKTILACLHPDRVLDEGQKKRYAEAFNIFNDLKLLLCCEAELPAPQTTDIPRTYSEMMARKQKVAEARRRGREDRSVPQRRS